MAAEGTAVERQRSTVRRVGDLFLRWREASISLVVIVLLFYFQVSTGVFFSEDNLVNVSQYVAAIAIVAVGQVFLLVNGEIDLSVGQVFVLAPFLMYFAIEDYGLPTLVAIVIALVGSAGIGLLNGIIHVVLGVPSFVTTLGMLFAIRGLTLLISGAHGVPIPLDAVWIQPFMGQAIWASLTWALLIVAVFHVLLTRTRWGLHSIAVGGNLLGATEAGIRYTRVKIGNFMICSALGGLAGLLEAFRINTIDVTAGGTETMFAAIAAAVIGGTALAGGTGTVLGALAGALMLGVLRTGFTMMGVNAFAFDLIIGIAILIAMVANVRLTQLRRAGRT